MVFVARIDALGTVADKEIMVELEPGDPLEDRHANFLGATRVDRRFVDHEVARLQHPADTVARFFERREIGPVVLVDRRGHGDDIDIASADPLELARVAELLRLAQLLARYLEGGITAGLEVADSRRIDIETDRGEVLAELDGERQPHVAKAHHSDPHIVEFH